MGVRIFHLIEGLWNRDTKSAFVLPVFMRVLVDCVKFSLFLCGGWCCFVSIIYGAGIDFFYISGKCARIMKLRAILVSLLVFQSLISPVLAVDSEDFFELTNLSELLNHIEAIDVEYTSDEGYGHFSYEIVGTEDIDDKSTWRVESVFGESGEDQGYTLWIDPETGKTLQAEVEGEVFTGFFAELYGNLTLTLFTTFIYNYWYDWTYQAFLEWDEAEVGVSEPLGKRVETFGATSLETWGMSYEGYVEGNETVSYVFEVWYAPTQFGEIMTHMSMTAISDETFTVELDLRSISLKEEQQVPESFLELVEDTPEPEPEQPPESETGGEEETESESSEPVPEEGGGIPMPISYVALGLLVSILLIKDRLNVKMI